MKALIARIYDYYQQQQDQQVESERKSKVGTGDRAEKIRTYNYPQNRENNFVTFYNDLYIPLNSNKLKAKSLMRMETAIQK